MRLGRFGWIVVSGVIWLIIGGFLLSMGLYLLILQPSLQSREHAMVLFCLGLVLGFIKGYFILSKTAQKAVKRISLIPEPISILQVYPPIYLGLVIGMMLLGMGLRWLEITSSIRGVIDVAVGFALMSTSRVYFQSAYILKQ
ncbi:hypothetical protein RHABOEDO_000778 [Candidatus Rhabdochlamydia oedothoracis]|uniref:Uncharacterized protein n=1 Tax=Candidatus Rhabdochlamydia oedothoracis TaxID=2720720 RepID=A0ABX8V0B4_9BACT|nr:MULTISPECIES: hypothetical protein [Rhabdochlamydia]KAG6559690.1 hypothetical protein RHOW815_000282 [Candidatus Rhabdochlamydia sp. W815]MCL6756682.1 hypothetical protein [Candidatus Rhabdochlamydia oedothoracis]QYF48591.1 hypothetical protein RHABOEDO_000778 [Candidatus Rhabdochlamydia oedothoracis]